MPREHWKTEELAVLRAVQIEHRQWADENFGTGTEETRKWLPFGAFSGIVEEIGEYFAADEIAKQADALADTTIYLIDLCGRMGIQLADVLADENGEFVPQDLRDCIQCILGKIAHAMLKSAQGIRNAENHAQELRTGIRSLVAWLELEADLLNCDLLDELLPEVWSSVKRRNWVADPNAENHGSE
jgi:NTP pyrophosphatase (non-canonical NTP hydrolase)